MTNITELAITDVAAIHLGASTVALYVASTPHAGLDGVAHGARAITSKQRLDEL